MPLVTSVTTRMDVTVTAYDNHDIQGLVFSSFCDKTFRFRNSFELISTMEGLYNDLSFPQAFVSDRSFFKRPGQWLKNKKSGECMENNGVSTGKAKFIIFVQYRQNATWQGTIQWVDENRTQRFRSALEMLKLMDEALNQGNGEMEVRFADDDAVKKEAIV